MMATERKLGSGVNKSILKTQAQLLRCEEQILKTRRLEFLISAEYLLTLRRNLILKLCSLHRRQIPR